MVGVCDLDRLLEPLTEAFTPKVAAALLKLRADSELEAHIAELRRKANSGTLTLASVRTECTRETFRWAEKLWYDEANMVLTREELIGCLQQEVHILVHLTGKIDRVKLDYKPTENQRTTLELLQYLSIMGPRLVPAIKESKFDADAWGNAQKAAAALDFDSLVTSLAGQSEFYSKELGSWTNEDYRTEIDLFGQKAARGVHLVRLVLGGHAAYRTQLFCYLKSCGRTDLSTWNLWAGVDAPA